MKRVPSLSGEVVRTYVVSVIIAALAIVLVGGIAAVWTVLRHDDGDALALAETLYAELSRHADAPLSVRDRIVREELAEERSFARHVEVWVDGGERLGGNAAHGTLAAWAVGPEGCRFGVVKMRWQRVCLVRVDARTSIVVATPLLPMLQALAPMVEAVAVAALLTVAAFASVSRRIAGRSLTPLFRFQDRVAALPARGGERRLADHWGAAEVDALAGTFNDLLLRIDRAIEREQRFVADAAHELRTPLTRLRAQLDLAADELREGAAPLARLTAAARSCDELGRMTEALLALAREEIEASEAVDLVDVVGSCLTRLDPGAAARIALRSCDEAPVRGDEALLALAVRNLLDNALSYSPGRVRVSIDRTGETAVVRVDDEGPGIAADELKRVCAPFVRGSGRPRHVHGAGLGLALVQHVATLHGGTLELGNRDEGGLRAALHLHDWRSSGKPNGGRRPSSDG